MFMYVNVCRHPGTLLLSCVLNCLFCIVQHVHFVSYCPTCLCVYLYFVSFFYILSFKNNVYVQIDISYGDVDRLSTKYSVFLSVVLLNVLV